MGSTRNIFLITIAVTCLVGGGLAGRFKPKNRVSSAAAASAASASGSDASASAFAPGLGGTTYNLPTNSTNPNGAGCKVRPKFSTPQECARTCRAGEAPKICHYTFNIEYYATLTNACKTCVSNATTRLVDDCQCITADGYEQSGIIVVNRMYPGPSIVICEDDYVVIDVTNRVPGSGITIHWHGILQMGSQYYDGVPFVTQCPIAEGTSFRYQWKAENSGTHFWHAHTGLQKAAGLEGAIIVREVKSLEPNNTLWEKEELDHVIFITDWTHDTPEDHFPGTVVRRPGQLPDNFLINGRGRFTDPVTGNTTNSPLSVFKVKPGHSYRFRIINACTYVCPTTITIQNHNFTVFSTDGEPVEPVVVTSITSSSAERYDIALNASEKGGEFWIQVRAIGACASRQMQQLAVLRYETKDNRTVTRTPEPTYGVGLSRGVVLNELNVRCDGLTNVTDVVCISQLKSIEPVPPRILKKKPDLRLYFPFGFYTHNVTDVFTPGTYKRFLVTAGQQFASLVSNISNVFPPSTLISQREDNPPDQICRPGNTPKRCETSRPCSCTHVYDIPLGAVVEFILVDESRVPGLSHPFHLHGSAFHILGEGCGDDYNTTKITVDFMKDLDKKGKVHRNMHRPPAKDTFALPNNGFSVIRFEALNPGYWLFHCHFLPHLADGMSVIIHIGESSDLPPVPEGFPQCGNFMPKVNF